MAQAVLVLRMIDCIQAIGQARVGGTLSLWKRLRRKLDGAQTRLLEDWITARNRAAAIPRMVVVFYPDAWEILRGVTITQLSAIPDDRVRPRDDGLLEVEMSGANLVALLERDPLADYWGQQPLGEPEGTLFRNLQVRLIGGLVDRITGEPMGEVPEALVLSR